MIKPRHHQLRLLVSCLFLSILSACSEAPEEPLTQPVKQELPTVSTIEAPTSSHYLPALQTEISQTWNELASSAAAMHEQTKLFTQLPSPGNLEALLTIWEQTHSQYQASKVFDLLGLPPFPREKADGSRYIHSFDIRLDQQPLILGYLDAVKGYSQSGLVYSEIPLTENSLVAEHQLGDIAYVAMGFHALKSLLTGDEGLNLGPEERFSLDKGKDADRIIDRRRDYAVLLSALILKDIQALQLAWSTPNGHFYQSLRALPADKRSARIAKLSEREQAILEKYSNEPNEHISQDSILLRTERLKRLALMFAEPEATEQATP